MVRPDPTHTARARTTDAGAGAAGGSSTPGAAELKAHMKKVNAWLHDNKKTVCAKCGNDLICRASDRGNTGMVIGCKGYKGSQPNSCHNMMTVEAKMFA